MTRNPIIVLTAFIGAAAVVRAGAGPQESSVQTTEALVGAEAGDSLYRTYCATCHGTTGKGDGPLASSIRIRPADLTRLTKPGEKYDPDKVARVIDGRKQVAGHGASDMPRWGDAFKNSRDGYSEQSVKARIDAIAAYLERLQAK